jgi:hypothetical protein
MSEFTRKENPALTFGIRQCLLDFADRQRSELHRFVNTAVGGNVYFIQQRSFHGSVKDRH